MSEEKLPRHETAFIHTGSLRAPSITFDAKQNTGFYLNDSEGITIKINNKPTTTFNAKYIEYKTPIIITNEANDMGILFKKPNDNNLWWKGNDHEEICLTKPYNNYITHNEITELKKIYNDLHLKYAQLVNEVQEFKKPSSPVGHVKIALNAISKLDPIIELSELSPIREEEIEHEVPSIIIPLVDKQVDKPSLDKQPLDKSSLDKPLDKPSVDKQPDIPPLDKQPDTISVSSNDSHNISDHSIEMKFHSSAQLEIGDIVGIDIKKSGNNGLSIDKVIGGKWEIKKLDKTNYNFILNKTNISLHIKDCVLNINFQIDEVSINKYIIMYKDCDEDDELINLEEIDPKNSTNPLFLGSLYDEYKDLFIVKMIALNHNTYLLGICNYKNKVLLIKLTIGDNKIIEQQTVVHSHKSIETFDILYEGGDLDILVLTMYNEEDFNFTVSLLTASPLNPEYKITQKYTRSNISDVVITGPHKTLTTLLIVGQVILIAYANTKTLLWLPSSADKEFSSGPTTINHNISDCISLYYDMENCVIISAEKTLTDYCFINIMDIYGTKIETQLSKKINSFTTIPLSLNYNKLTGRFILFYTNALTYGSLNAQIFSYNCDNIITHARYSTEELPVLSNDNFKSYYVEDNTFILYCYSNKKSIECKFFDNYKIQPETFIGMVQDVEQSLYNVTFKGQVFTHEEKQLPFDFIGKKLYLNHNTIHLTYPYNITTNAIGNTFIGTAINYNSIILGL